MEDSGQLHAPASPRPKNAYGNHWMVGFVGPTVGLHAVENGWSA